MSQHFLGEIIMLSSFRNDKVHSPGRRALKNEFLQLLNGLVGPFGSLHLSPLLSIPRLLKPVAEFVEATGRFVLIIPTSIQPINHHLRYQPHLRYPKPKPLAYLYKISLPRRDLFYFFAYENTLAACLEREGGASTEQLHAPRERQNPDKKEKDETKDETQRAEPVRPRANVFEHSTTPTPTHENIQTRGRRSPRVEGVSQRKGVREGVIAPQAHTNAYGTDRHTHPFGMYGDGNAQTQAQTRARRMRMFLKAEMKDETGERSTEQGSEDEDASPRMPAAHTLVSTSRRDVQRSAPTTGFPTASRHPA
ncbi:hypothetical protein B0H16DRAFT_1481940 [Mycena metata]|uniref:Uncharacterized protein n=1 Tax=Mycena metata TaxID=1033252 RepID=A0AAD7GW12_9AGAR|nr:hypothetical protein B0H16DRAFT_1481940 [Mycena metata]